MKFLAKKVIFLVSSKQNEISKLLASPGKILLATPGKTTVPPL